MFNIKKDLDLAHLQLCQIFGELKQELNEDYNDQDFKALLTTKMAGFDNNSINMVYYAARQIDLYNSCNSFIVLSIIGEIF